MSRHIHKTEAHAIFFQESEPEINRDSAALLLGQPIRMRAGQRFDQRRFAVSMCPAVPTITLFEGLFIMKGDCNSSCPVEVARQ